MPKFFLMNEATDEEIQRFVDSGWDNYHEEFPHGFYSNVEERSFGGAAQHFAETHGIANGTSFYATILEEGAEECVEFQLVNRGWEIV